MLSEALDWPQRGSPMTIHRVRAEAEGVYDRLALAGSRGRLCQVLIWRGNSGH